MAPAHVHLVEEPHELQALSHPLRIKLLEGLREPASAAELSRSVSASRQNVNYHLKELERAGLAAKVGERKARGFTESLYQAVASSFVVSPRAVWGDGRRLDALRDQLSLENLVVLGERLGRDAAVLLDRAAFEGEEIASASVETEVRFASEEDRAAFLRAYLAAIGPLLLEHGQREGAPYRVVLAAYPDPDQGDET